MRTLTLATFCAGLLTMLKYTYRYDNFFVLFYRCCDSRNILRIVFAILTFAISIVDILTFRHFDFDIVTVDIFIVDILTVHQVVITFLSQISNKFDSTFRALNHCAKFHQNQIKIAAV